MASLRSVRLRDIGIIPDTAERSAMRCPGRT